jgi:hypothetical protein
MYVNKTQKHLLNHNYNKYIRHTLPQIVFDFWRKSVQSRNLMLQQCVQNAGACAEI